MSTTIISPSLAVAPTVASHLPALPSSQVLLRDIQSVRAALNQIQLQNGLSYEAAQGQLANLKTTLDRLQRDHNAITDIDPFISGELYLVQLQQQRLELTVNIYIRQQNLERRLNQAPPFAAPPLAASRVTSDMSAAPPSAAATATATIPLPPASLLTPALPVPASFLAPCDQVARGSELDRGLETCPTIEEIHRPKVFEVYENNTRNYLRERNGITYPFPREFEHLYVDAVQLAFNANEPEEDQCAKMYLLRDLDNWLSLNRGMDARANYTDFLYIATMDNFYPRNHLKGSPEDFLYVSLSVKHATSLMMRKNGSSITIELFDPWGIDALDPHRRDGFIAYERLVRQWAVSKGFSFVSLPQLNVKMQFSNGNGWEQGGVCRMFTGLYMYLRTEGFSPEVIRQMMVNLSHAEREKLVRQFTKCMLHPSDEGTTAFNRILRSLSLIG